MTSRHQRAKEVFLAALSEPRTQWSAVLEAECGTDEGLRQEVESLLAFHDTDPSETGEDALPSAVASFAPGEVFATRYRMVTRIGKGGMGDVWRADDLVLGAEVALKLIDATSGGRERILNEVRLARQITHPNVCRVFDVGESGGWIFYSMEFVRGEDLASLLRRVGRLPSEKVVDISRQLCAGLAAAHAEGVFHRDLKPANILIDDEGRVRITDFGIAIPRTSSNQHLLTGTPGYMAPEQRTVGAPLSERTDIYSLGLVLYELLVGAAWHRSGETGSPPLPSALVPNVHPQLERIVMQAMSVDPANRPASAQVMAAALPELGAHRPDTVRKTNGGRSGKKWLVGAAAVAVVGTLAVASSFLVSPVARTLNEHDTVVLADFENRTGDPVFDGALKVALAVAIDQSPFLRVFPDERARQTLQLMERSPDERVTRSIAREIARRERLKALLAGSISSLGRNYVIALETVNAETGDVMAREQAEVASKEEVLAGLGRASARLREKLGESLSSIQRFDVPLPRATTVSLDALRAYSLALTDGREVPRLESIPHLKRAIELDPTFAMAHAVLSGVYANTDQSALAPAFSRRAFELRDRVSERERFFVSWRYYRDAVQDWEKALEVAQSWVATYPQDAFGFNSLGTAYMRMGQFEEAIDPYRKSIELDPRFPPAYSNLAAALMAVSRYDDARDILRQAADRHLEFIGARRLSYLIAFVQGDTATMARELEASVGVGQTNAAFGWQARTSAFGGRIKTAHDQFRRGIQMSLQGGFHQVAAQLSMEDAETHAIVGQCATAKSEVTAGLELSRDNATIERASRTLAICGTANEALAMSRELAAQFPEATLTMNVAVPLVGAAVALQRNETARAIEQLEQVKRYDRAPSSEFWGPYLRGIALLRSKDGRAAEVEFRSILSRHGEVPGSLLYPLSQLGAARAASLSKDTAGARESYDTFFKSWKDADPDVPLLKEARSEYAALAGAP